MRQNKLFKMEQKHRKKLLKRRKKRCISRKKRQKRKWRQHKHNNKVQNAAHYFSGHQYMKH